MLEYLTNCRGDKKVTESDLTRVLHVSYSIPSTSFRLEEQVMERIEKERKLSKTKKVVATAALWIAIVVVFASLIALLA